MEKLNRSGPIGVSQKIDRPITCRADMLLPMTFAPGIPVEAPTSHTLEMSEMVTAVANPVTGNVVQADIAQGRVWANSLGYSYTYDSRTSGLAPNKGFLFEFGPDYAGLGGNTSYIKTEARAVA